MLFINILYEGLPTERPKMEVETHWWSWIRMVQFCIRHYGAIEKVLVEF